MILKQLSLANFRNYEQASFSLRPEGNLVIAPNGWGKTNLLESIAYCGLGKSVRFHRDHELKRENTDFFSVRGEFEDDSGLDLKVQISWQQGRKLLKINDIPVKQLSRIFENIKVIYAAPEDMNLVGGYPRFRRQYFDLAISQIYPPYITTLREYLHVVEQRNSLFKRPYTREEKLAWDTKFCSLLLEVLDYRKRYLELVNGAFAQRYPEVSEQVKDIRVLYLPHLNEDYPATAGQMIETLAVLESREKRYQRSLAGAHIDDYEFRLNGHNLKTYGSQGQKRITVIILKLIQAALIQELTGIRPILLFDDVFAELDKDHAHRIAEFVDYRYQIFIASPREDLCLEWPGLQRLDLMEVTA
ncbi:MAG: DNA replication and repair protein RecF [Candidatus Cloacimonetes bacterium]|nr:DNA replication and repair protein RecF [Candidatus Cloacimonadota bacterium]